MQMKVRDIIDRVWRGQAAKIAGGFLAVFLVAVTFGCEGRTHFDRGMEFSSENNGGEAAKEFELAVLSGEEVVKSHIELGNYYSRIGGEELRAVLHFREALSLLDVNDSRSGDIQDRLKKSEKELFRDLVRRGVQNDSENLLLKVRLLEEHARNQSKWLDELRRENAQLRRELGDSTAGY